MYFFTMTICSREVSVAGSCVAGSCLGGTRTRWGKTTVPFDAMLAMGVCVGGDGSM